MNHKILTLLTALLLLPLAASAQNKDFNPEYLDITLTPKVGVTASKLTGGDGDPVIFPTFGAEMEMYLAHHLSVAIELGFMKQGAGNYAINTLGKDGQLLRADVSEIMFTTSYFAKWRPAKHWYLYAGFNLSRVMTFKVKGKSYRDEFHSGDLAFPIGVGYESGRYMIEARVARSVRKMADTKLGRALTGDGLNEYIMVNCGYRFQIF